MKSFFTPRGRRPRITVAAAGLLLCVTAIFGAANVSAQAALQEYGTLDPYTPLRGPFDDEAGDGPTSGTTDCPGCLNGLANVRGWWIQNTGASGKGNMRFDPGGNYGDGSPAWAISFDVGAMGAAEVTYTPSGTSVDLVNLVPGEIASAFQTDIFKDREDEADDKFQIEVYDGLGGASCFSTMVPITDDPDTPLIPETKRYTINYADMPACSGFSVVADFTQVSQIVIRVTGEDDGLDMFVTPIKLVGEPGAAPPVLDAEKSAAGSYDRTIEWSLKKYACADADVESTCEDDLLELGPGVPGQPFVWDWLVVVTNSVVEDNYLVTGDMTLTYLSGDSAAEVQSVGDELNTGVLAAVTCPNLPVTLAAAGESLACTYTASPSDDSATLNTATFTFLADGVQAAQTAEAPVGWTVNETGDASTTLTDVEGPLDVELSSSYSVDYPGGYECERDLTKYVNGVFEYEVPNTAYLDGEITDLEDDATVKIRCVIEYGSETAYAKAPNGQCFIPDFKNWGWTNPIVPGTYTWDLWAGAGQCDTGKGTLVGTVTVVYDGSGVNVTYNVVAPYTLDETHVYAGGGQYPLNRGTPTVAPGAYYVEGPFGGSIWVIAHAVVGLPMTE
jgi:hypothetical protein